MPFPHRAILFVAETNTNEAGISPHAARGLAAAAAKNIAASRPSLKTPIPKTVRGCHELIRQLQRENVQLREAGSFFGQLAERLNLELRQHRDRSFSEPADARYSTMPGQAQWSGQGNGSNDH
jgi:hypothetical protein